MNDRKDQVITIGGDKNSAKRSKANNNNTSNNHQAKQDDKVTHCFSPNRVLVLLMGLSLIIAIILVAIFTVGQLDQEDQCLNSSPFQQQTYKLFSTKTAYSSVFQFLNQTSSAQSTGLNYRYQLDVELPSVFSSEFTQQTIHRHLEKSGCRVRQLHYIGRHAARYPSSRETESINRLLAQIQNRIDLSKFPTRPQPQQPASPNNDQLGQNTSVCSNPLAPFKQWQTFMSSEQSNLVTDTGFDESLAIAGRLKALYPDLFDATKSKIELGMTGELRTAQSALAFVRLFDNYSLDFCNLDQFPEGTSDRSKAHDVTTSDCFNTMTKKFYLDKLSFHKKCEALHKEDIVIQRNLNLKDSEKTQFIANSVSKKLKLSKEEYLTTEEVRAIYKVCKYEVAYLGSSIWCNLFSDSELRFYEYLSDVDDFFNQAYGHPDQARSACPVTTDLIKSFKAIVRNPRTIETEAHFYFTHSAVIQKLLAASVDLESDPEYSPKTIATYIQAQEAPRKRQWQTSLLTPFSANLAFTLYECPQVKASSQTPDEIHDFDAYLGLKVVASLNERPILLDGCQNHICDLNELISEGKIYKERKCKLEDICRTNIVIT